MLAMQRGFRDCRRVAIAIHRAFLSHKSGSHHPDVQSILAAALPNIRDHGWTDALTLAIREAGLSDQAISVFPNGAYDLVRYYARSQKDRLASIELKSASVLDKVKELMQARLMANSQLGHRLGDAVKMLSSPKNFALSSASLAELSDEIWYLAGDKSTDASWYTKRAAIAGIYAASETYMASDHTAGHKSTFKFLNKQLDLLKRVEYAESSIMEWAKFNAIGGFNVIRSLT